MTTPPTSTAPLATTVRGCPFHGTFLRVSICPVCEAAAIALLADGITADQWYAAHPTS